jgi:hypothetical protein
MRVPDPMAHDFGLGSDFSEASTPGGRAVRRAEEPSETFGCPANWTAERCFLRRCYRNPGKLFDPGEARNTLQFFGVAERVVKDLPEVRGYFGRRTARRNELSNPVAALDDLPGFRRALMGFAALVSGAVAGLAGTGILPALPGRGLASTLGVAF